jgi:hypothetical protein
MKKLAEKTTLRSARPHPGTLAGLPASGLQADQQTFSDPGVVDVLAARTPDHKLLAVLCYRDVSLPATFVQRVIDGVTLRA